MLRCQSHVGGESYGGVPVARSRPRLPSTAPASAARRSSRPWRSLRCSAATRSPDTNAPPTARTAVLLRLSLAGSSASLLVDSTYTPSSLPGMAARRPHVEAGRTGWRIHDERVVRPDDVPRLVPLIPWYRDGGAAGERQVQARVAVDADQHEPLGIEVEQLSQAASLPGVEPALLRAGRPQGELTQDHHLDGPELSRTAWSMRMKSRSPRRPQVTRPRQARRRP